MTTDGRKKPIRREHRQQGFNDPFVSISGERVRVSRKELIGMSLNAFADAIGEDQRTLDSIEHGKTKSVRRSRRRKLARKLGVAEAWLGGEIQRLPGAIPRAGHRPSVIYSGIRHLVQMLEPLERVPLTRRQLTRDLRAMMPGIRGTTSSLIEVLSPSTNLNQGLSKPLEKGLSLLIELREIVQALPYRAGQRGTLRPLERLPAIRAKLARLVPTPKSRSRNVIPSYDLVDWSTPQAQLVAHRLRLRCFKAWKRDMASRYPKHDLTSWPNPDNMPSPRQWPSPWKEWMQLDRRLDEILTPEVWRSGIFEENPPVSEEDWDATVTAIARLIERLLTPWFEDVSALTDYFLSNLSHTTSV